MAGWTSLKELLKAELKEQEECGKDISSVSLPDSEEAEKLSRAYDELMMLPMRKDYPYEEPDEYQDILAASESNAVEVITEALLEKKIHAAWVGRAAGCALGKPVERGEYMSGTPGYRGYENVIRWFRGADAYPIDYYTPSHSRAEEEGLRVHCEKSCRENIQFMESDDDVRYTVLGLRLMEEKGMDFTTWDVGKLWHRYLSYSQVCTAETQAYLNFAQVTSHINGWEPEDAEEKLKYVRTFRNPYREWIGAQIRVDAYGYAAAGNPDLAAKMAYTDARLSHEKNGVYGAMFCAAMIAAAFTEKSLRGVIECGLRTVPKRSRLYEAITDTLNTVHEGDDPEAVAKMLWDRYEHYDSVHTINNAAVVAASLLLSGGDFEKGITFAVLCGWDTDCNGATVGSILGAFLGEIPEKWSSPLHDTMYAEVAGFDPVTFTELAHRCIEVRRKNVL